MLVFIAAHGLSLVAESGGWLLFPVVHELLIAVGSHCRARALRAGASLVVACGLLVVTLVVEHRLRSCGARA